ncbi:hypothetical protein DUNSADRAFT_14195 [Dunaliella salina]|uniref:Uncharacterized protein n=1 Tax=Dunaliella salina TaxID=3046 RepID=A0ABQ7G7V3_DUNSA|nr:hypothetical protein DUNSADRAFT_14195 [Dunaliella salina]|eukprot:KAF5830680.1 hypothetical protein DUNSADRAFT_14195 [Dunaliella salina]
MSTKYQATNKDIIAAYSKFYGLLLQAGYDSWTDYVLDQLLYGRDSAFARAVAQGSLEQGAPVLNALAHDLDKLQDIAVDMRELATYIAEVAPTCGNAYVAAAASPSLKSSSKKGLADGQLPKVTGIDINGQSATIQQPLSAEELSHWQSAIASKKAWSEAAPLLVQYYYNYGFGITSRNSALRWVKGSLEEASDEGSTPATAAAPLACLADQHEILAANTIRHCEGLRAGRERGLRIVDVNGSDSGAILEAARGCGRYPRIRFILVADHMDFPVRSDIAMDLMAGLSGVGSSGWPSNTLLYMGVNSNATISSTDPLISRFGLPIVCQNPKDWDEGLITQLMEQTQASGALPTKPWHEIKASLDQALPGASIREASRHISQLSIAKIK